MISSQILSIYCPEDNGEHHTHYGNRSVRNVIYTGLLSADRRLPYISDNEEVGTSINFIKTVAVV